MSKKFSIILPSRDGADRIGTALESIRKQTVKDYELIVVCDSCTDRTEEIAKRYGAKTVRTDVGSFGGAENAGLDAATGDWVLFMDDDDWWVDEHVMETIERNLDDGIDMLFFGFDWLGIGHTYQDENREYCAVWNKCWRRSFIGNTRFSESKRYGTDLQFHSDMIAKGPRKKFLHEVLYFYNYRRPGSMTDLWEKGEIE